MAVAERVLAQNGSQIHHISQAPHTEEKDMSEGIKLWGKGGIETSGDSKPGTLHSHSFGKAFMQIGQESNTMQSDPANVACKLSLLNSI
jgi:hypothetical protein